MDALKTDLETKVKAVLTKEQHTEYVAYMEKQAPKQGGQQKRQLPIKTRDNVNKKHKGLRRLWHVRETVPD
ncbi:MAG: hypothetical protein AB9888_17730 [Bacteroidales bacterium]